MSTEQKILVVDDDPIGRQVLVEALNRYQVRTADDGREALSLIATYQPDLVLLDVNLPEMSGYEVCQAARENRESQLIKIVLVSANISLEERLKGYSAGADDYITKPFNTEELQAKVDVFVKLKREEEVNEAKSNLLGLFTHETRTPLGVIIGLSDLLRSDQSKSAETRKCAEAIHQSSLDLHQFIEKTTLLGRLRTGYKPEPSCDYLYIHVPKAMNRIQHQICSKEIRVIQQIPHDIKLTVDWEMFDGVVGYIIENAVKYSNHGADVFINASVLGSECRIAINDQGVGISKSWIDNIFGEFAVRDIKHHSRGQGLSLSIAKQVVELHGGRIEVESEIGSGTSFTIFIPVTPIEN